MHSKLTIPDIAAYLNSDTLLCATGDTQSRGLAASPLACKLINLSLDEFIGTDPFDLPLEKEENASAFYEHNKIACSGTPWNGIERAHYQYLGEVVLLTTRLPVYNSSQQEIIGVFWYALIQSTNYLELITSLQHQASKVGLQKKDYCVLANQPHHSEINLTNREAECLYFTLRGMSAKHIGIRLSISNRTVERYLEDLKHKFTAKCKSELITSAMVRGFFYCLPPTLFCSEGNNSRI